MPQVGPITMWVISMTLTPSRGNPLPAIGFSVLVYLRQSRLGFRAASGKYNLPNSAFTAA
jgi:hypothetical protein